MIDPHEEVVRANQVHYAKPGAFDYVGDKYHTRRIRVATALLKAYLPPSEEQLVLVDIGPGDTSPVGDGSYPASRRIAIDAASEALERTQHFDVKIVADVTEGIPLADCSADAIFCGELIEHLFDPRAFLHECSRVLVPGGLLLVTTPNIATLQDRIRFVFGRAPRHINPLHDYIRLHIRPFTPELLERTYRDAGFTPLAIKSNYLDFHIRGRRHNVPILASLFPRLGGTIIAIGRKPNS